MSTQQIHIVTQIASTSEAVWNALTDPDMTQEYWGGTRIESDWKVGSKVLYLIDGKVSGTRDMYLPKRWSRADQSTAVWLTGLADAEHTLDVRVTGRKNPASDGIGIALGRVVSYRGAIAALPKE